MKRIIWLTILIFYSFAGNIFAFDWGDIGDAFKNIVPQKALDPVTDLVKKGWEKKHEFGEKLDKGADKLEGAPVLLEEHGIKGLQEGMVDGLNNKLITTLIDKTSDIAHKRADIANFKKLVTDNEATARTVGKGQLVQDLKDGLTAADEALAMIWGGPDLKKAAGITQPTTSSGSQSAIARLRSKVVDEAKNIAIQSSPEYKFAINRGIDQNKENGILGELLFTGRTTIVDTQNLISQMKSQIQQLKDKINAGTNYIDPRSLIKRMRDLANFLNV